MSSPEGPSVAASKQSGKIWLLLGAAVVVLAVGGVVAFRRLAQQADGAAEPEKPPVVLDPGVLELEPFLLNLADPAGDRYFRLNLHLVLDQRAIAERAASGRALVVMHDRILSILAKKRASQVTSVEGKESLRAELLAATEALLAEEPFYVAKTDPAPARVLEVLFTEFLVQ